MTRPAIFVLTGAPRAGKTTVLRHLEREGHRVVHEAARDVIVRQGELGSTALPWKDLPAFQERVLEVQLEREAEAGGARTGPRADAPTEADVPPTGPEADAPLVFSDRGVPDGLAYLRLAELGDSPIARRIEHRGRERYRGVFLLEPLPGYRPDGLRRERPTHRQTLQERLEAVYRELGYDPVHVPAVPVEERVRRIVERARAELEG